MTHEITGISNGKKQKMVTELDEFDEIFPELVSYLISSGLKDSETTDACKWFKEVLEYNVPHGKKNRGMFVTMAYKFLVSDPKYEDIRLARILGWCIELLQAFFLIADDVMDDSYTRRGKPCWFRKEKVGMEAINDSIYLECCIYKLLKHYIKGKPYYIYIMELFHEITMCTVTGQCLDMTVAPPPGNIDFTNYTEEKYRAIVKWKTAFYSFYLPVAIAMYMAEIYDESSHDCARTILLKMGEYFQVQDDYLDCYGDESIVGKIGTDIQDNKCSWLVITALHKANDEQIQVLKANYGSTDTEKVAKVKQLYKDLDLEKSFKDFEEKSYQEINTLIENNSGHLPKEMFKSLVQKIYKRNK
ncbi:hypothetical protein ACF0H5_016388 [Mactra antiquata]